MMTLKTDTRHTQNAVEVWGLTGGVASGKSTAARFFEEAGIPVIDADQIARELSAPGGAAHEAILQRFGTADRVKLRELVFSDSAARRDLEAILHPLIQMESMNRISKLGAPRVIYEAALLVETGRYETLSGLIVVDAPPDLRKKRLIFRDKLKPKVASQIIQAQASDAYRRGVATVVIENTGSLEELRARVRDFIQSHGWD